MIWGGMERWWPTGGMHEDPDNRALARKKGLNDNKATCYNAVGILCAGLLFGSGVYTFQFYFLVYIPGSSRADQVDAAVDFVRVTVICESARYGR